ncbi:fascin domain-containing protein [Streptomyces nitrosporeus]|uniref:fascin domain-containing protein n=1 Tax=Streptomyces nitrosporeus TaxID=28894 RepID=UPI003327E055
MRRTTSVLLSLSTLLAVSALAAPGVQAATPKADGPVAVPSGWEAVDGTELARIAGESEEPGAGRAPFAADGGVSTAAVEPELLSVRSARNGKFVATEASYPAPDTGALRARSAQVGGGWEGFAFEWDEASQTYALRSLANNLYVAVEKNYTGSAQNVLRARSATAGGWERFALYYNEGLDRWALQSTLNGKFVAMENGYTGSLQYALRARSAEITGSWEEFSLQGYGA